MFEKIAWSVAVLAGKASWQAYSRINRPPLRKIVELDRRARPPTESAPEVSVSDSGRTQTPVEAPEHFEEAPSASRGKIDATIASDQRSWADYRNDFVDFIAEGRFVFIDSNIWMNPGYVPHLEQLMRLVQTRSARLHILGEQFAEIDRLRKSSNRQRAFEAREATRLIKSCSQQCVVSVGRSNDRRAILDVDGYVLREFAEKCVSEGRRSLFVTEDIPLLAHLYSLQEDARRNGVNRMLIVEGAEFKVLFDPAHADAL